MDLGGKYVAMGSSSSKDKASPKGLRILCFGDSLTSGFLSSSMESYPYGETLQTELAHMLSLTLSDVRVTVDGLPGTRSPKVDLALRLLSNEA